MSDWRNQHAYHPATEVTAPLHDMVRNAATALSHVIEIATMDAGVPQDAPEVLDAHKAVHAARMWANMAIAVHAAPVATEEQRRTPQPTHGQGEQVAIRERPFTCPNCRESVVANTTGHINPHWAENGYEKAGFTCLPKEQT